MLVTPGSTDTIAKIKVVGVGGAGSNSLNTMIADYAIDGVEFYAFNTDAQALKNSLAPITLQLGNELTRGLGAGGDPSVGASAAEESLDAIHEHLAGADMVFITAGMGGGTGTGAAPVVAGVAKNLGALTVAVVTKPFKFEGRHREKIAEEGLAELRDKVDCLIIVPNQRLLDIVDDNMGFFDAMKEVDRVLAEGVKSISSLVTKSGFINVDFADVKSVMTDAGTSLMGMGKASGENRAATAARQATTSPLLDMSIEGATGVLFNVVGNEHMTMKEINEAAEMIFEAVDPEANVIFGATVDSDMKDELMITIVATGFDSTRQVFSSTSGSSVASSNSSLVQQDPGMKRVVHEEVDDLKDTTQGVLRPSEQDTRRVRDITSGSSPSATNANSDVGDPLEVPAFMRKNR